MSSNPHSVPLADVPSRYWTTCRRWRVWTLIAILAPAILVASQVDWTSTQRLRQQARSALERGDFSESSRLGRRLMDRESSRAEGILFAAESSAKLGRFDEALRLLEQVLAENPPFHEIAKLLVARIQCDDLKRPTDAERTLRDILQIHPTSEPAHDKLAFILGLAGRSWEAISHRLMLISQDQFQLHHLSLLALGSTAAENPDLLQEFAKTSPEDLLVKCGLARVALREGRINQGEQLIDDVIRRNPSLLAVQAWKGELLLHCQNVPGLADWQAALPEGADELPQIWFVRGRWAMLRGESRVAVRCFWECLRRDPTHQPAAYQLSQVLAELGDTASAELFRQQARLLGDLITAAKTVEISGSPEAGQRAADACDALGLRVEAGAWREVLQRADPTVRWQLESPVRPRHSPGAPRLDPASDPARKVNFESYPLPQLRASPFSATTAARSDSVAHNHIRFADQAESAGIKFTYRNGSRPESDGEYMYEFSGGGVAAFDFDVDGWPDLYFTQGSDKPPHSGQEKWIDRIYRNMADGRFVDCTTASGIFEPGFSQGCAAGDFDNDGFPDLYVANIGANRFFHNNGDGTFTDVTDQTGTAGDRWTTSCAIADLNGDGNPDVFTVNYVTGKDLFTQPCRMPDGSSRLCTPHEFAAAHDQLFVNREDGRFEDQSQSAGIEVPEGKGLGVVAGSFDRSGGVNLFVANDAVPNFYFVNTTPRRGERPQLEERGYVSGLAVDADGQSQACMGVAAGDANGDGLLDLFITNFRNESNTLYLQQPGRGFVDATRSSGLREPSFAMLGFGTQFLDADLDGWQDLVLTNGHVGNLKHHGVAYEMPPQFFRNLGTATFVELPASALGPFFAGNYLGRGLARLDWNRDGREDFLVSHLKSPVALVTNETAPAGNFLVIQLCGVESNRDAIGSIVTVNAGTRRLVRHLTAGDGYQACNQRQLVFGLGDATAIDGIEVYWPTGKSQRFTSPTINTTLLLIEGRHAGIVMQRP